MSEEWLWAAAICGIPFVAFAATETIGALRRRRLAALARRPKAIGEGAPRRIARGD